MSLNNYETLKKVQADKLQRAEERALAAEMLIASLVDMRNAEWGCDRDEKTDRALEDAPNLTAAREVLRKAEECDARIKQNETQIRIHMQNTREWKEALDQLRTERDELAALVQEVKSLAVSPWSFITVYESSVDQKGRMIGVVMASQILALLDTPATALADLKARMKREVLEEAAKLVIDHPLLFLPATPSPEAMSLGEAVAAELRRMAGEEHA